MKRAVWIMLILFSISGCSSVYMNQKDRELIGGIYIDGKVDMPELPFVYGKGQVMAGMAGGAAGALIAEKTSNPHLFLKLYLQENSIDIAGILKSEFEKQLKEKNAFNITPSAYADTTLSIKVNAYGLAVSTVLGLSDAQKPLLNITVELKRKNDNKVIWRRKEHITNLSGLTESHPSYEYYAKPELMRASFENICEKIVQLSVKSMSDF